MVGHGEYSQQYCNNCTMIDGSWSYQGDHFVMDVNVKSLCCTLETIIILYNITILYIVFNYTSVKKNEKYRQPNLIQEKRKA